MAKLLGRKATSRYRLIGIYMTMVNVGIICCIDSFVCRLDLFLATVVYMNFVAIGLGLLFGGSEDAISDKVKRKKRV